MNQDSQYWRTEKRKNQPQMPSSIETWQNISSGTLPWWHLKENSESTGYKTKLECHLADKTVNYPSHLADKTVNYPCHLADKTVNYPCHLADKTVNYPGGLCEGLEAASHEGPHGLVVVGQGRVNHRQLQHKGEGWQNREMGEQERDEWERQEIGV